MDDARSDSPTDSWIDEARAALVASWRRRLAERAPLGAREVVALAVVVAAVVVGAGVAFVRAMPRGSASEHSPIRALADHTPSPSASPGVVVYVAGAVRRPGVYALPAGARIVDALERAGGLAPEADVGPLNLAAPVADGAKVYVPRRGETPPPDTSGGASGSSRSSGGKININTATAAELDAGVPGVGPVLAQRIVDYRTQHGPFRSINDLTKVEGIGQKKFGSLKDFVTV